MSPKKIASALALSLSIVAGNASAQAVLTAETGPPGTVPFTAMTALAEIASKEKVANFQVADSQTLTNSLQNVAEGKTDVSGAPLILSFLMSRGAGPYAKLGKEKGAELIGNVRALYTYNYGGFGLYAYNSASVKGWDTVKGKTILNGPPRGAALTNDRGILTIVAGADDGKDYKGIQVNWGQMAKTISDGSADGMMLPVTFPDNRITRSLAAGDMTLWSIPKDIWEGERMQKYIKSPGTGGLVFDLKNIPPQKGLTIVSEDGIWRSPTTLAAEVVNKSMDFDTAKALTAAMLKNTEAFLKKAPYMATTKIGNVGLGLCGPVPLKYHPGAVAAFEEAGMKVPDCAKPGS
ncbi:MAG: TAXI family TRAP transporter solute-binding subunit [Pseudomonadota bacterium]